MKTKRQVVRCPLPARVLLAVLLALPISLVSPVPLGAGVIHAAGPIYVRWNATGTNNGSSWANAYTALQTALAAATSGDEIWVAAGTYKPFIGGGRATSFHLGEGVALYGGFVGNETSRDQRDWAAHKVTLSGDIGAAGNASDNVYHVVDASNTTGATVLDGFTISSGNANGSWFYANGGGIYALQGSPTVRNCLFIGNLAKTLGGGFYSSDGSPALINVAFSGNWAGTSGGGMYAAKYAPLLINVTFAGNSSGTNGGGFYSRYVGSPSLVNCILWGNSAPSEAQIGSANDSSPTVMYSLAQGGYPGTDALDDDPLFVRTPVTATGDYGDLRLRPGSPAIDAGDDSSVAGIAADLACGARLRGAHVDLGAYEAEPDGSALALRAGWNLISLPLAPPNSAITQALASIAGRYDLVYGYDPSEPMNAWKKYNVNAPPFLNSLSQINEAQGLWIRMTSAAALALEGTRPTSPTIALAAGWNLVGYPSQQARPIADALASIAGQYDLVYAYDPADALAPWKKYNVDAPPFLNSLSQMTPGWGYWIRAKQGCTWQLP